MHRTLDVGVDLDGVLYSFDRALARWIHRSTGRDLATLPVPDRWNVWEVWDMTAEEFGRHVTNGIAAGFVFADGDPYPGAAEALHAIAADGHRLHVVTDRGRGPHAAVAEASTRQWLDRHGIVPTTLLLSADKTAVAVDTFIEDRDRNFTALLEHGSNPYLVDRPWNRHVDAGERRLPSTASFAAVVRELAAN